METQFHSNSSGNLKNAVADISSPAFLFLFSNVNQFEEHVKELNELFPNVPSIGCVAQSYNTSYIVKDSGVSIVSYYDIDVKTNLLNDISSMPIKYIKRRHKFITMKC